MKPAYARAAERVVTEGLGGKLAAVDATAARDVASRFQIKGYPTLKYFKVRNKRLVISFYLGLLKIIFGSLLIFSFLFYTGSSSLYSACIFSSLITLCFFSSRLTNNNKDMLDLLFSFFNCGNNNPLCFLRTAWSPSSTALVATKILSSTSCEIPAHLRPRPNPNRSGTL